MHKLLFLLLLLSAFLVSPIVFATTKHIEILGWEQWSAQTDGTNIVALPQIGKILRLFEEDENITVEIHYHDNDQNDNSGKLWAESLGRWLVTFGIPTHYIVLFPDSDANNQIIIALIDRR